MPARTPCGGPPSGASPAPAQWTVHGLRAACPPEVLAIPAILVTLAGVKSAPRSRRRALASKPADAVASMNGPAALPRPAARTVVPLRERKRVFGDQWQYAPAPEDHKFIPIAPRHNLFINGRFCRKLCRRTHDG